MPATIELAADERVKVAMDIAYCDNTLTLGLRRSADTGAESEKEQSDRHRNEKMAARS
jgi:Flp pilus assembly protein CpaB